MNFLSKRICKSTKKNNRISDCGRKKNKPETDVRIPISCTFVTAYYHAHEISINLNFNYLKNIYFVYGQPNRHYTHL